MEVTLGFAFLAGLASFLSPCVFSLVPAYVGYLSGRAVSANQGTIKVNKFDTFTHGMAFVLGFSFVFITVGMAATMLGSILYSLRPLLSKIGGVVVIFFGLHMAGVFRIKWLEYDLRPQNRRDMQRSYLSSGLMGVFFSAGWSPCVGPVLGAIYTIAMNNANLAQSIQLLVAYSTGLAVPFLAAAVGISWVTLLLRRYQKALHYVEMGMGYILVAVGIMLFLGIFEQLAGLGWFVNFGI